MGSINSTKHPSEVHPTMVNDRSVVIQRRCHLVGDRIVPIQTLIPAMNLEPPIRITGWRAKNNYWLGKIGGGHPIFMTDFHRKILFSIEQNEP